MKGLRFECQPGCTNCCTQKGFVYLTEADLQGIAKFLGMRAIEFERRYVYRTKRQLRLRVPRQVQCHFLVDGGCSIHAVKPTQCRVFPFWPELVDDKREWQKIAAWCPGIGEGKLVQIETAGSGRGRCGKSIRICMTSSRSLTVAASMRRPPRVKH